VRIAVAGVDGTAVRLRSAEAKADDPGAAGEAAVADVTFADDALASAWYRERTLPVLVRRALSELREAA
jgi:CO/xanthine dehydrogenase FAD-binding subunit